MVGPEPRTLDQGSPAPGLQNGTGPRPVGTGAAQQEVSGPSLTSLPELCLLPPPHCLPTTTLSVEKPSSVKLVPGARKGGGRCSGSRDSHSTHFTALRRKLLLWSKWLKSAFFRIKRKRKNIGRGVNQLWPKALISADGNKNNANNTEENCHVNIDWMLTACQAPPSALGGIFCPSQQEGVEDSTGHIHKHVLRAYCRQGGSSWWFSKGHHQTAPS